MTRALRPLALPLARLLVLPLVLPIGACAEGSPVAPAAPVTAPSVEGEAKAPAPSAPPAAPVAAAPAASGPPAWPSAAEQRAAATAQSALAVPFLSVHPGCEASAAADHGDWLLVGDNEQSTALLALPAGGGAPRSWPLQRIKDGKTDDWKIKDIEALVRHASGLVVVGSFGRRSPDKGCGSDSKRQRIGDFAVAEGALRLTRATQVETTDGQGPRPFLATAAACGAWLGPGLSGVERAWADALCLALSAAEQGAARGEADACNAALNVEGAVLDAQGRLWLGLRAPRLTEGAALLRVAEAAWGPPTAPGALQVDAVALVALPDGAGVRELASADGLLHLLSGPGPDMGTAVAAWSTAPLQALQPGQILQPTWRGALPDRAEGLQVAQGRVTILIDGEKPKSETEGDACAAPSMRLDLQLSAP